MCQSGHTILENGCHGQFNSIQFNSNITGHTHNHRQYGMHWNAIYNSPVSNKGILTVIVYALCKQIQGLVQGLNKSKY